MMCTRKSLPNARKKSMDRTTTATSTSFSRLNTCHRGRCNSYNIAVIQHATSHKCSVLQPRLAAQYMANDSSNITAVQGPHLKSCMNGFLVGGVGAAGRRGPCASSSGTSSMPPKRCPGPFACWLGPAPSARLVPFCMHATLCLLSTDYTSEALKITRSSLQAD